MVTEEQEYQEGIEMLHGYTFCKVGWHPLAVALQMN